MQDARLGSFNIKAKDEMIINYYGLHFNSKEWQHPYKFLPERFDPENPLFLTPEGKKRHPFSYVPWNGGRRGCIGQSFADKNVKTVMIYMLSHFDFKFADPEMPTWHGYPMCHQGQSKRIPIMVNITEKE